LTTGNTTIASDSIDTVSITSNSLTTSSIISSIDTKVTIVANTNTTIDSFGAATFRTAKYIITASNDAGYESLEVLLIHDNSDSYITVYGAISTLASDIINVTSNIVGGNVKVYASGNVANTVVNLVGTYVIA
jgi:hypothetical protein